MESPIINAEGAVFITGATSGLGRKVSFILAKAGRNLVLAGRRKDALKELVSELEEIGNIEVREFQADLSDLNQIRSEFEKSSMPPLHGVFANAGITTQKLDESKQGYDMTFAVNVLSHQLLLDLLTPNILDNGRVVIVSSGVHRPENKLARICGVASPRWVGVEALANQKSAKGKDRLDNGTQRYSTSKLANVLQAAAYQNCLKQSNRNIDVFALDPGLMVDTELAREFPEFARRIFYSIGVALTPYVDNMRLSDTTAQHVKEIFESQKWAGKGFAYLDGNRVSTPSTDAQRADYQKELWADLNELLGITQVDASLG